MAPSGLSVLTVPQLKTLLLRAGLPRSGARADVLDRVESFFVRGALSTEGSLEILQDRVQVRRAFSLSPTQR